MSAERHEQLLKDDPGNPVFAEVGEEFRKKGLYDSAFGVCFAGLSANPACYAGRLLLARLFYEKSFWPFAIRELQILREQLPENRSVNRILEKLAIEGGGTQSGSAAEEGTVAETEFDFSEIDLLSEEKVSEPSK